MVSTVETMGMRLRAAREQRSLKQSELADMVGMRPHSLWRYEAGRAAPGTPRLLKLARALGVRLEWLVSGEGPMATSSPPPPVSGKDAA
jgi:transcriptional regulator with XRE-family HTH domain